MPNSSSSTLSRLWPRRVIQAVSFFMLAEFSYYGIFRCPFAVPYVSCANCPVVQCPGKKLWYIVLGGIAVSALFFGRAFCGYACPVGTISDLFSSVALMKRKISPALKTVLQKGKYIVAIGAAYLFFAMQNPRWAVPIRTGEFINSTMLTFEHASWLWLSRTIIVAGAIALGLVIPYFFCRFICPTGGVLELFSRFSFFKYTMTSSCFDCGKCDKACKQDTRPAQANCTNCGACKDTCPVDAISITHAFNKKD
ncbi:4Fe-4S binding protein [Halodesulfovibrio aestuarii]|uniref:4Fe-4S binding protein n=1 Tax=Halodesulfovibrio aestuarii TaxID=126333 RepID=UPI003D340603